MNCRVTHEIYVVCCAQEAWWFTSIHSVRGRAERHRADVQMNRMNVTRCPIHLINLIRTMHVSASFQLLYEDNETNRMHESLNLFASIVNNIYFEGKPFIMFFNKFDLFEEKIKTSSLAKFFPDYQGEYQGTTEEQHKQRLG